MSVLDPPNNMEGWLVIDGYEDEPAAFGVPNYLGFHIRYIFVASLNLEVYHIRI